MNQKLHNVTRTLHELIKSLPAIKAHCSAEVVDRHMRLIAHFQHQYDLIAASMVPHSPS